MDNEARQTIAAALEATASATNRFGIAFVSAGSVEAKYIGAAASLVKFVADLIRMYGTADALEELKKVRDKLTERTVSQTDIEEQDARIDSAIDEWFEDAD